MELDNFDNNKGTPTKRIGSHNSISLDYEVNSNSNDGDNPEIHTPRPSNATNDIPIEVPGRGVHGDK